MPRALGVYRGAYSTAEDETIKKLHAAGHTFTTIAMALPGRRAKNLAARAVKLGLKVNILDRITMTRGIKPLRRFDHSVFRDCLKCRLSFEAETTPGGRLLDRVCLNCKRSAEWRSPGMF